MKSLILSLITLLFIGQNCDAQVVQVRLQKDVFKPDSPVEFVVYCASEQDLELVVFSGDFLALHQQSTLLPGDNYFEIKKGPLPVGKYFILVTGNGIHVEKEFTVKDVF